MEVNKEKIRYILQFFYDKGENARQTSKIVNGVYGDDTVTENYVQFWFRRFRSGNFDVKEERAAASLLQLSGNASDFSYGRNSITLTASA